MPDNEDLFTPTKLKPDNGKVLLTQSPTTTAALDGPDETAGNARHQYVIQYGGPADRCDVLFQQGPRGKEGSQPGIFDDDLMAILQDRLEGFQSGPFAHECNAEALDHIKAARAAMGRRVVTRMQSRKLGLNKV